jgi:hypothetical protein
LGSDVRFLALTAIRRIEAGAQQGIKGIAKERRGA